MSLIEALVHKAFILERKHIFNNLPEKIFLVNHGDTEANLNESLSKDIPEYKIKLTKKGEDQALEVSKKLQKLIKPMDSLKFYVSSYLRALQTFDVIKKDFHNNKYKFISQIEPLLREQEFGTTRLFLKEEIEKRKLIGKYYYRGKEGESGSDVFRRVERFKRKLIKQAEFYNEKYNNIVLITHACWFRVFALNFLDLSIDTYHHLARPKKCDIWIFEKRKKFDPVLKSIYDIKSNIEFYKF